MDADTWREHVTEHRREKDRFLAEHPASPIPDDERTSFEGLAYFDPDPAYRFEIPLRRQEPRELTVATSTGDERTYERVGTFTLELPEGTVELAALASEDHDPDELFVPFQDATSGDTTYGAGRYLEAQRIDGDVYLVDLNQTYHPFCAYNEAYACPLPPPENRLEIPVRAGERLP